MTRLKKRCVGKGMRYLVFFSSKGSPPGHFLRMCENIATRAGFDGSEWELHRWRKTFVTMQHEKNGVSVNTLRVWLGHESLDVTLAYLKGSEAADEHVQEKVNNGVLAAFAQLTSHRISKPSRLIEQASLIQAKRASHPRKANDSSTTVTTRIPSACQLCNRW
jgi:hypothetical protein